MHLLVSHDDCGSFDRVLTLWICVKGADVAVNPGPGILLKAAVSAANDPMVRKAAAAAQLAAENKDQIKEVVDKVAPGL